MHHRNVRTIVHESTEEERDKTMKIAEYLDECRKTLDLPSDYALAARWKINRSYISGWRAGTHAPDALACVRIAEALRRDPTEVMADIYRQTEKQPDRAAEWDHYLGKIRAATRIASTDAPSRKAEKETATLVESPSDRVVGREWLEHSTYGLRVRCSTN